MNRNKAILLAAVFGCSAFMAAPSMSNLLNKGEIQEIAEEAYLYAFPMVMAYAIMYENNIDKNSSQYKGSFNQIVNESRVFTPKDTSIVTPNSDTPYSILMMDLRAEPMVICVPKIEKDRYYSVQLTSQYTFNFGYIGSRATGNEAACYGVAGTNWDGKTPGKIRKIFQSETEFAIGIFRTQLFNADDMDNVKKIQENYKILPLSTFLNQPAPKAAPEIAWPKIDKKLAESDPFTYLNFLLQFAPPVGSAVVEKSLRERFAKIGIMAGKPFAMDRFSPEQKAEIENGIKSAREKIKLQTTKLGTEQNHWRVATDGFGDRAALKDNWTLRAAAAMAGIYGNDAVEALYPLTKLDSKGKPLDGSKHNYTLTFPANQLPPVKAFWSVTMYDGKTQLLIENPINRYLINSPMLPSLKKNPDGSLTLYIQKESPGKDKESNWLPAPDGSIYLVMRLYWPKDSALKGRWKPPAVKVE